MSDPTAAPLREVVAYFLRLGSTAFGGPAAHIALMRHDLVERKGWLDDDEYAEMIALANLVPGPNSTEVAMHVGRRRAGTIGMIAAGLAFIAPAFVMMLALGWAYTEYGTRPGFRSVLAGIAPVVVVLIAQAILQLGRTALRGASAVAVGLLALAGALIGIHELVLLAGAGLVTWVGWWFGARSARGPGLGGFAVVAAMPAVRIAADLGPVWATAGPVMLAPLFVVFLQIGAVLYGSGYVLYALLEGALVHDRGWLTERQLLDAIAMGQLTPGPLFTTATFIGYTLRGLPGALVATVGIFLPAFCFVGVTGFVVHRLRGNAGFAAFLRGVVAASLALMVAVAGILARDAFVDVGTVAVAAAAAGLLWWRRPNPVWLILAGGVAGALVPGLG
ncbi:MAG: chromate efflux transporter [Actinomycetota bacterium]